MTKEEKGILEIIDGLFRHIEKGLGKEGLNFVTNCKRGYMPFDESIKLMRDYIDILKGDLLLINEND